MAESQELQQAQQPSQPRAYVNFAAGQGGPMDLVLTLGYREGDAQPVSLATVTMTWEFVPLLTRLLQEHLDAYQEQVGPVRDMQQREKVEQPE